MSKKNVCEFDVLVIGGGVIGASIFYHLALQEYAVGLLDKNCIASGCTAQSGGIIRCFHLDSSLSDKAVFGWNYYRNFEKKTGEKCLFNECEFVYFPKKENHNFTLLETKRLSKYILVEWLNACTLKNRFNNLLVTLQHGAVYESQAGYMDPIAVTWAWVRAAQRHGGITHEQTTVQNISFSKNGIYKVNTTSKDFFAKRIVIAAGPHTPSLLDKLGYQHDVYTQIIQVDLRRPTAFPSNQPAYIDDCFELNGRPDPNSGGIYIGYPTNLRVNSFADHLVLDPQHSEKIWDQGAKRFTWVDGSSLIGSLRSADCYTADGNGRVMALDDTQTIFVASGFSGGGFKMAPWIGNEIANLITATF
jgi:glycine/D-amino acid oxidase-like deaminating enzyme